MPLNKFVHLFVFKVIILVSISWGFFSYGFSAIVEEELLNHANSIIWCHL